MPIETLLKPININIRDLQMELPERWQSSAERAVRDLKQTPLYDRERGLWLVLEETDSRFQRYYTEDQLMGVIITSVFNKDEARDNLKQLKHSKLFNDGDKQWIKGMDSDESTFSGSNPIAHQLLGIVAGGQLNRAGVQGKYNELKHEHFDEEHKRWIDDTNGDGSSELFFTKTQLIGVIAEALFDKESAKELYKEIKADFYDSREGHWHTWVEIKDDEQLPQHAISVSQERDLLGVWAEAMVGDRQEARARYKELRPEAIQDKDAFPLRNSNFFDLDMLADSPVQLLCIYLDHIFEENPSEFATAAQQPLPQERNF
jgi:hypothetical protein